MQATTVGSFWARAGTCDEVVLRADYWQRCAFARGYAPTPGDVLLDIGAHIGAYAIPAALATPGITVHAVEPSLRSFRLLQRNIVLNSVEGSVIPHHAAISGQTEQGFLNYGADSWADAYGTRASGPGEPVIAFSLVDFLTRANVVGVQHLKLNAEGSEYPIILGSSDATLRRVESLLIEYHPLAGFGCEHLTRRLAACDFRVEVGTDACDPEKGWLSATC